MNHDTVVVSLGPDYRDASKQQQYVVRLWYYAHGLRT